MLGARLDEQGAVIVDTHCESSVRGLYAAGDVVSAIDQLAVAVGHAAIAATAIHNRLRE
jgi:thioredoxin reductase (NADPH)